LSARRPHLELYLRWMQETRRFKPSTVSRRVSVVAGLYRTAVIDDVLESSPAEHVRRPLVLPESTHHGVRHPAIFTGCRCSTPEPANTATQCRRLAEYSDAPM